MGWRLELRAGWSREEKRPRGREEARLERLSGEQSGPVEKRGKKWGGKGRAESVSGGRGPLVVATFAA